MRQHLFTDQLGRTISVPEKPRRIISLVPSQTELLADLGLEGEVIGITKFCIHPDRWFRSKTRVGGTKQLHLEQIAALQPDLIIANKEENEQQQVEWLMERFPVWTSDIKTLEQACEMITAVGELTGTSEKAKEITSKINAGFAALQPHPAPLRAAYFIWQEPLMCAGTDTFISHLMQRCNLQNVFSPGDGRYPEVTAAQLHELQPDVLLLSSEPFPFAGKHREAMQEQFPGMRVELADGEYFSWYGSRLVDAPGYFTLLLNRIHSTTA